MVTKFLTCTERPIFTLCGYQGTHYPVISAPTGFFALLLFVSHLCLRSLLPFFQEFLFSSLEDLHVFHKADVVWGRWQSPWGGEAVSEVLGFGVALGLLCLFDDSTAVPVVCTHP